MVIPEWEFWIVIATLAPMFFVAFMCIVVWIITLRMDSYHARPPL